MPIIQLTTNINAPVETCFNLSRSIDLHMQSMAHTQETAIDGITSGLIGLGETVTWKARHFGIAFKMTSRITAFEAPYYFIDEMANGPFKKLHHTHLFQQNGGYTIMKDVFYFASPFGLMGSLANALFLKKYLTALLDQRNEIIKCIAEQNV